jgi:hypothetical protein
MRCSSGRDCMGRVVVGIISILRVVETFKSTNEAGQERFGLAPRQSV